MMFEVQEDPEDESKTTEAVSPGSCGGSCSYNACLEP